MMKMRLADVAAVTGGLLHRATGDERVTAVEFDSRAIGPGGLPAGHAEVVMALVGGHHVGSALAATAAAVGLERVATRLLGTVSA